jgi:hypothetical protein
VGNQVVEDETPEQKLRKLSGRRLELRRSLGVLWPLHMFEEETSCRLAGCLRRGLVSLPL